MSEELQCWETLLASRMRPCVTMPKEQDASKRAKKIRDANREKTSERKEYLKAWRKSDAGKLSAKRREARYLATEKGRAVVRKKENKYYALHKNDPEFREKKNARNRAYRARKREESKKLEAA